MPTYIKNFRWFRLNENLNSYNWPKWMSNMTNDTLLRKAAGSPGDDVLKSYFVEAGKCLADFEVKLQEAGWKKTTIPAEAYTVEKFNNNLGNSLKQKAAQLDSVGEGDTWTNLWKSNVEVNLKESAWNSPDGKSSIHISTWESFTDWAEGVNTNPGILFRKCSGSAEKYKSCAATSIAWNGGELSV